MTRLSPEADPEALAPRDELSIGVPPLLTGKPLVVIFGAGLAVTLGLAPLIGAGALFALVVAFVVAFAVTSVPAKLVLGYDGLAVVWLGRRLGKRLRTGRYSMTFSTLTSATSDAAAEAPAALAALASLAVDPPSDSG